MQDDRVGMTYAIDVAKKTTASADCATLVAKASKAAQNKTGDGCAYLQVFYHPR